MGTQPDEDKRMNGEEAEGAEFFSWTAFWSLRELESAEKWKLFPFLTPRP